MDKRADHQEAVTVLRAIARNPLKALEVLAEPGGTFRTWNAGGPELNLKGRACLDDDESRKQDAKDQDTGSR